MDKETDGRAQELAIELRGMSEQERKRFLETLLNNDLRLAVERLLGTAADVESTANTSAKAPTISTIAEGDAQTAFKIPSAKGLPQASRFLPRKMLGSGGQGEVWLALDPELDRDVAIKVLKPSLHGSQPTIANFRREAEVTGKLEHPNIVPIYEANRGVDRAPGEKGTQPFYVMRVISEQSLHEAIRQLHDGKWDSARFRELLGSFVDICNAVAYAHSRGVIHRDLKPQNVMLGEFGETLLVDWGLAKVVGRDDLHSDEEDSSGTVRMDADSSATVAGTVLGTPQYMSPEQANGLVTTLGPTTDIYGLGAILYCLLTGSPPVTEQPVLDFVREGKFPAAVERNPRVPKPLNAICSKALQSKRVERYRTALELAADISRWLNDEPVSAWNEPLLTRCRRWIRSHQVLAASSVATVTVAMITLSILFVAMSLKNEELKEAQASERVARHKAEKNESIANANRTEADIQARLAIERQIEAEEQAYLALVRGVNLERADNPTEARRLLAQTHHDNEWEWRFLHNAVETHGVLEMAGHTEHVQNVDFNSDGRIIASASMDGTVRFWDADNGMPIGLPIENSILGKMMPLMAVAFAPNDPHQVAVGGASVDPFAAAVNGLLAGVKGDVTVWSSCTSGDRSSFKVSTHSTLVTSVAFNVDGTMVASVSLGSSIQDGELKVARISDRTDRQASVSSLNFTDVVFHPDGKRLLTACQDGTLRFWSIDTLEQIGAPIKAHSGAVTSVTVSGDGERISSSGFGGAVRVWNADTREMIYEHFSHSGFVMNAELSPDGTLVASAGWDKTIRVANVETGETVVTLYDHKHLASGLAFSPDGQQLAAGSGIDCKIRIFDARKRNQTSNTGAATLTLAHDHLVSSVALSPSGSRLISADYGGCIKSWNLESDSIEATPVEAHAQGIWTVAFSANGDFYATASWDKTLKVWNAENGQLHATFDESRQMLLGAAFNPQNANELCASTADGIVYLWTLDGSKETKKWLAHTPYQAIFRVAYSGGQRNFIASVAGDKKLRLWAADGPESPYRDFDIAIPVLDLPAHDFLVSDVAFSPDESRFVTSSTDGTIKEWKIEGGVSQTPTVFKQEDYVYAVAYSDDGRFLASGGADRKVTVREATSGRIVRQYRHPGVIRDIVYSHGRLIAGGGFANKGVIKVWTVSDHDPE